MSVSSSRNIRPREIFRGFSALWFLKYFGQFLSGLAISGLSKRFSPGKICSKVGRPEGLWLTLGPPTSERKLPGENLSEWPEIARALRNWPKYFKNHRAENPRKISRGLECTHVSAKLFKLKIACFKKSYSCHWVTFWADIAPCKGPPLTSCIVSGTTEIQGH